MICPNCHTKMEHDFCIRCGYMINGNTVDVDNKYPKQTVLEMFIGEDFYKVLHAENNFLIFILGPAYFSYRNHLLLGFILEIIEILLCFLAGAVWSNLIISIVILILNRFVYMVFANPLYLKLSEKRINKIITKDPNNYMEMISNNRNKKFLYIILTLGLTIILIELIIYFYTLYQ